MGIADDSKQFVTNRFEEATEYADKAWGEVDSGGWLAALKNLASTGITVPFINEDDLTYDFPPINLDPLSPEGPEEPDISIELPDPPQGITLSPVSVNSIGSIPTLNVTAPSITIPDAPDPDWPADVGDAPPVSSEIELPPRPNISNYDFTLPSAPSITTPTLPGMPNIDLPAFDGVMPNIALDPPGVTFFYNEDQYQSDLKTALEDYLLNALQNGGTGLGPEIEEALWARARARQESQNEALCDEALNFWAARGWEEPPGGLLGRLQEINIETQRADAQLNYEITIEQARLAQENTHFIITTAVQWNGQLLSYANEVAQRAFESAKYTQQAAIEVFNSKVTYYNLLLSAYQANAQVYEARIRAAMIQVEIFRTQLEASKTEAQIQSILVDIYRAQVGAIETMAQLYATEMEGAKIRLGVEQQKLGLYREKVNAFTAKINGITAQYNAHQAHVAGEAEKARVYSEQVRAYNGEVDALRTVAQINVAQAQAQIEANRALIEELKAKITKYNAETDVKVKEAEAKARIFGFQVNKYEADIRASEAKIEAQAKSYDVQLRHESNVLEIALKQAEANLRAALQSHELRLEALSSGSRILSQMTASALSSVSASAQFGFHGSDTSSKSESTSVSTSTSHVYNY